eukprot:m.355506 g.355506  ORF g.355506 m.355506 type:complete len:491 (+) comp17267_c0_seq1:230-1702(+)
MSDPWDDYDDEEVEQEEAPFSPEDIICVAKCVYPFESTCDVELTLMEGDRINVTRKDVGGGWWEGELNGQHGLFPESYVVEEEGTSTAPPAAVAQSTPATPAYAPTQSMPSAVTQADVNAPPGAAVILAGQKWHMPVEPLIVDARKGEHKGSKLGGIKKFTVYEIGHSTSAVRVERRFKHFDWLHARFSKMFPGVAIPALPDKQVQGRFDDEFIEHRRQALQKFLNRVARHPVLGTSSIFRHFLTATDQKEWKSGKRQAESESNSFFGNVIRQDALPPNHRDLIATSKTFSHWVEKQMQHLDQEYDALLSHFQGMTESYASVAVSFRRCGDPLVMGDSERPPYEPWWTDAPTADLHIMLNAIGVVGEGIDQISGIANEHNKWQMEHMSGFVKEYLGLLKSFQTIFKTHDAIWAELTAARGKDTSAAALDEMQEKCETVSAVIMSELRHFHESIVFDFRETLRAYLIESAAYHRKTAEVFDQIVQEFDQQQ